MELLSPKRSYHLRVYAYFRYAKLCFLFVFQLSTSIIGDERFICFQEISSLSVEPREGESLTVTVFAIKKSEIPSFIEREHEFRFLAVQPETLEGTQYVTPAVLGARYSNEEYFQNRCKGSKEVYHERYGRYNSQRVFLAVLVIIQLKDETVY